jgi:hypothetical protein
MDKRIAIHMWVSYMGIIHGYHTWVSYMGIIHGYHTWVSYMGIIHGYHTWYHTWVSYCVPIMRCAVILCHCTCPPALVPFKRCVDKWTACRTLETLTTWYRLNRASAWYSMMEHVAPVNPKQSQCGTVPYARIYHCHHHNNSTHGNHENVDIAMASNIR